MQRVKLWMYGTCCLVLLLGLCLNLGDLQAQEAPEADAPVELTPKAGAELIPVDLAWARNSVNAVIFRHNAITTHDGMQYLAYYNPDEKVVVAKRNLGETEWTQVVTDFTGNVRDAHNAICIAVDGDGYLHMSWDHHGHPLRYVRSVAPGAMEFGEMEPMTGQREERVTYPEFYNLSDGGLLFFYRDGSSGRGDAVLNRYDLETRTWRQVHTNLIGGEDARNAYWQVAVDEDDTVHLSWNWRVHGGVETNHDLCYARSEDGGETWTRSNGEVYELPITADTAEYATRIPQNHELINQTTMATDSQGRPYIATYWRPEGTEVPQLHMVFHDGTEWHVTQVGERTEAFTLSGGGAKLIPISRPDLMVRSTPEGDTAYMLFRDEERGGQVTVAICDDLENPVWRFVDLTEESVYQWEPNFDKAVWREQGVLHAFTIRVGQGDGETLTDLPPQMLYVLEWDPEGH